jgi:hypothetical protein
MTEIDLHLDCLASAIEDLYELRDDWDGDLDDPWHYSEMLSWRSTMSRLDLDLDPAYRAGQMTPEQAERYRALLARLKEALPVIDQLGFARPRLTLEA